VSELLIEPPTTKCCSTTMSSAEHSRAVSQFSFTPCSVLESILLFQSADQRSTPIDSLDRDLA
jgi:hypothetical protein